MEVYAHAIKFILTDWRRQRAGSQPPSEWRITAKIRLLENLAYQFACEEREVFPAEALYAKMEGYLQGERVPTLFKNTDSDALLRELTEEDGILQKLDHQGDNYLFLHRTFQEYFTAAYLNHQPNGIALAKEHFWDLDWHETLILFAGLRDDPLPFLQALSAEKDDIFASLLLLTGQCLAECGNQVQLAMTAVVDRIYGLWRSDLYRDFTRLTVVAIGQVNERLFTRIQQALRDPNSKIKWQAAKMLRQIGDARAIEGLLVMLHDADFLVRMDAMDALGAIGDAQVVPKLLVALRDEDDWVRGGAAGALWAIGDARAVGGLLVALRDADYEVTEFATRALGAIGGARAVMGLLVALRDADDWVRRHAAKALGEIGDARAVAKLLTALHDADGVVIDRAAEALGTIGDAQAVTGLLAALRDENVWVRQNAAEALGVIEDAQALAELLTALHDTDGVVRGNAAEALGAIGNTQVVSELLVMLHDVNYLVRNSAAKTLGQIGDARAVGELLAALHDSDNLVRSSAVKALGQIGTLDVLEGLVHRPEIDIYDEHVFTLTRRLAIKFSRRKPKPACLPLYPERLRHKRPEFCRPPEQRKRTTGIEYKQE